MASVARTAAVIAIAVLTSSWVGSSTDPTALVQPMTLGLTCGPTPAPDPDPCFVKWTCNTADGVWDEVWKTTGTSCSTGVACITGEKCGAGGCGGGVNSCTPPTVPGPITGPTSSSTGAFTLSWGIASDPTGGYPRYELRENAAATVYSDITPSVTLGKMDGTYRYDVRACNSYGCSAYTAQFTVTVLRTPPPPFPIIAPSTSASGAFTVSWTKPSGYVVDSYILERKGGSGSWATIYSGPSLSYAETVTADGVYSYRASARSAAGTSSPTPEAAVTVEIQLGLTLPDAPLVQPAVPAQQFVGTGTIPGSPSVEGGAATYRIEIEVPPGRAGMQPQVALTYGSRNGNGVVGVGWSLSGASTIYRCPRTLSQDGGNAPVRLVPEDRLCFDGRRLVAANVAVYGQPGSEYRTEIDPFDRIILQGGDMSSWSSSFQVEHKSGRISRYEPVPAASSGPLPPSTWYRTLEYDRAGNCITYVWSSTARGLSEERVLTSIQYTGTMVSALCSQASALKAVNFEYTANRSDKKTTYQAGVGSMLTSRLAAITTTATGRAARRYELAYHESAATSRSLLSSITLCGGATCGAEKFAATSFTYQESFASPPSGRFQNLGTQWTAILAGDYDGDGTRDMLLIQDTSSDPTVAPSRYLQLSSCGGALISISGTPWFPPSGKPLGSGPAQGDMDATGDGRADLIGTSGSPSVLSFASFNPQFAGDCTTWTTQSSRFLLTPSTGSTAYELDYDGDGLMDVHYQDGATGAESILRRTSRGLTFDGTAIQMPPTPAGYGVASRQDFNGDGLVDTFFDGVNTYGLIAFFNGPGSPESYSQFNLGQLGGTGNSFSSNYMGFRRWIDVNGDGLPDIFDYDQNTFTAVVYINRGGPVGSVMFSVVPVTSSELQSSNFTNPRRREHAMAMDVDADAQEELLIPDHRVRDYCYSDPTKVDPKTHEPPYLYCGADFDTGGAPDYDRSVFAWAGYKFRDLPDGSYEMVRAAGLVAPIGVGLYPGNYFGDGMTEVLYRLKNCLPLDPTRYPNCYYVGLSDADAGLYISSTGPLQGAAPDLLLTVTDGLGASASWSYQPLSKSAAPPGCDATKPFYVAHHLDPRSQDYVYFTSSMWGVSKFDVSNGIGAGMNTTCYRYEDAMLNTAGRGFQGFKKIVSEERLALASGESASVVGTCSTSGCSPNNRRTTTEFNQEFPFAGKPRRIATGIVRADGTESSVSETKFWWHAELAGSDETAGPWVIYPTATTQTRFDYNRENTSGGATATSTTVVELDAFSGEPRKTCTITDDMATRTRVAGWLRLPASISSSELQTIRISQETRTLTNDPVGWWLGRVDVREELADFTQAYPAPDGRPATTVNKPSAPTSPLACPSITTSSSGKGHRVEYVWYADSALQSYRRKPSLETVKTGVAATTVESTVTYAAYDGYGNLSRKVISARGVADTLVSTYTYDSGGYALATETNPVGHVSTVVVDPATGLVTSRRAVQGGPVTTTAYDSLGRLLSVTTDGQQPMYERLMLCTACGDVTVVRMRIGAGIPGTYEYSDRLGRVIRSDKAGFDGGLSSQSSTSAVPTVVTELRYNERGLKIAESAPRYSNDASVYWTEYAGFDALGRVGTKTVHRDPTLFAPGRGDPDLVTNYSYQAFTTRISVDRAGSGTGTLEMSRTTSALGKLVETTQDVSSPTAHTIPVRYVYDPAGNLTHIVDSGADAANPAIVGNDLAARYDDLGRKTNVIDPDRGTWIYEWDGLSRLVRQIDARGATVRHEYDDIGRPVRRFTKGPEWSDVEMLDASWIYDPSSASGVQSLGVLGTVSNSDGYAREYRYDSLLRPFRISTKLPSNDAFIPSGLRTFVTEYGYDGNYGRPKAMRYPSGEMVSLDYSSLGYVLGETELLGGGARGRRYRVVNSMSPFGQVTDQTLGNCTAEVAQYDKSAGMAIFMSAFLPTGTWAAGATCLSATQLIRQVTYKHDHFLNLYSQEKNFAGEQATETYRYDDLQRITLSTRAWLTNGVTSGPENGTYEYNDLGNITSKPDYATNYVYGDATRDASTSTDLAGPHAVRSVVKRDGTTATFSYDLNGNMLSGDGRRVTFDSLDRPVVATLGGVTTLLAYAPDGGRYRQSTTGPATPAFGPRTVYYVDKDYELTVWNDGSGRTEERTYVDGSVVVYRSSTDGRDVRYRHLDRLGSLDAVTATTTSPSGEGAAEQVGDAHSYDAFGKPRTRDFTFSGERLHPGGEVGVATDRGFTGHEHLDNLYLIHMNGRVYDYRLGRFLSVDPIISNAANSQSINPYSYLGNNPLSGIDPTGYEGTTAGAMPTPCESAAYCRQDGTLAGDGRFSSVLNARGDVIAGSARWDTSGATGLGPRTPNPDTTSHGGLRDTADANDERSPGGLRIAQLRPPRGRGSGTVVPEVEPIEHTILREQIRQDLVRIERATGKAPDILEPPGRPPSPETARWLREWANRVDPPGPRTPVGVESGPSGMALRVPNSGPRLQPSVQDTLDRIARGETFPHRNDGKEFMNRGDPTPLPVRPPGYYHEYVHPTAGISGPGPQRIVIGNGGEVYFTPDHYNTFIVIRK
jgi:RHS repeat-associated protein